MLRFEHSPAFLILCLRYFSAGEAGFQDVQWVVAASTVASAHHEKHHRGNTLS
jgi:hypothetical protein